MFSLICENCGEKATILGVDTKKIFRMLMDGVIDFSAYPTSYDGDVGIKIECKCGNILKVDL